MAGFPRFRLTFNPLHCGAVVASERPPPPQRTGAFARLQSPSLRGSGRFSSPFIAGDGGR
jgi:hypothetical protein